MDHYLKGKQQPHPANRQHNPQRAGAASLVILYVLYKKAAGQNSDGAVSNRKYSVFNLIKTGSEGTEMCVSSS